MRSIKTLPKKIISKLKFFSAIFLLRLAALAGHAPLAAAVMSWVAWRTHLSGGRPVVLCLGRSIFVDDIKAMVKYSGRIEYAGIHLQYFEAVMQRFFSTAEFATITEDNYHHDASTLDGKRKFAAFLRRMLPPLRRRLGFTAVMSGNFGYTMQQELEAVCAELAVPFIVLHKEGQVGFGGAEFAAPYKTFRFPGAKVLLYNEKAKKTLLDSGMPGLTPDKIEVVGAPRLDFYIREAHGGDARDVVLFSFSSDDRFHYITDKKLFGEIVRREKDFHRFCMEFASRHPNVHVTIKTKNARHYLESVQAILREFFPQGLQNLTITNAMRAETLIQSATAVLGYNSTTLIEGLMAGKTIISPDFSDLLPADSTDFFAGYEDVLNFARSSEELERLILHPKEHEPKLERREAFLRAYVYIPDGQASARAESGIIDAIARKREAVPHA